MRLTQTLCASVLVALPALAACSSDSNKGSGGNGGASTGGYSTTGGYSNSGGTGGTLTTGGTAGAATGGNAGTATGGNAGAATGGNAGAATGGTAGTATGGTAGTATGGTAGTATGGTAGVTAGGAGGVAGSGATETCPGCARLSVPLTATTDNAHFVIGSDTDLDLSTATITFHVCRQAGTGGIFQAYLQTALYAGLYQGWQSLATISACPTFQDIVFNVETTNPTTGTYDKAHVRTLGIEVSGGNSTAWTNPTVVYVDSITFSNNAEGPFTFDSAASIGPTTGAAQHILWLNSYDTPTAGSTLTWLGP